ncbi:SseB family protein [Lysobacter sp. TAF61]|uniref:SseB family protein n=1 Tax=Lysobacter sp. TAF61 TaxID=3233072 RepID=UPI003F97B628
MNFLNKLLGNKHPQSPSSDASAALSAHEAIQQARIGRLPIQEMLAILARSSLFVPLASPPEIDGEAITAWKPSTVSKADGSQWVVAFTNTDQASEFCKQTPAYSHGLSVGTKWLLQVLPPGHGIVINIGTAQGFEWNAGGIAEYKARVSRPNNSFKPKPLRGSA